MDCSTPGSPVLPHLPELAQTHVHWVGDAIQPSHPRSSPSLPALSPSLDWREWRNIRRSRDNSMAAEASWSSCFSYSTIGVHFVSSCGPFGAYCFSAYSQVRFSRFSQIVLAAALSPSISFQINPALIELVGVGCYCLPLGPWLTHGKNWHERTRKARTHRAVCISH